MMLILMMMLAIIYPLDDDLYLPPCVERIEPSKEGGPAWRTHLEMCVFGFLDLDLIVNDHGIHIIISVCL